MPVLLPQWAAHQGDLQSQGPGHCLPFHVGCGQEEDTQRQGDGQMVGQDPMGTMIDPGGVRGGGVTLDLILPCFPP